MNAYTSRRDRRREQGAPRRRRWTAALALVGALTVLAGGAVAAEIVLPIPIPAAGRPTVVLSRSGRLVGYWSRHHRIPIPYGDIPRTMKEAIVATEDATFWTNLGFNLKGIARAALVDLLHRRIIQGGSTITQQLAKNLYLTPSRTLGRKLEEALVTIRLTAHLTKAQILTLYLNTVYFGEGAYGLEAASQVYFGRDAPTLTLAQSALLAGLVEAPSAYDPYVHPRAALRRRAQVVGRMLAVGDITPREARRLDAMPLGLAGTRRPPETSSGVAPYFIDYAVALIAQTDPQLARDLALGGYTIHTTLSLHDQRAAVRAMADQMPPGHPDRQGVVEPEGALVAVDPRTGGILAMVGGRSYRRSPFNRAVYALRQPGSTFKLFLYATLLSTPGYTAASMMTDAPVAFPGAHGGLYRPHNASGRHLGPIPVRRALEVSDNVVAVKWADLVGLDPIIRTARSMGIDTPLAHNLTLVLGSSPVTPLAMAGAYAALADGGVYHVPFAVTSVTDATGRTVWTPPAALPTRALSPQVAYILTGLLRAVLGPYGTGAGLASRFGFEAAGKTGTSSHDVDGWFDGYTTRIAAVVWVGYDAGDVPLPGEGSATAGPVWSDFMRRAAAGHPPPPFPRPEGVVTRWISPLDGLLANSTEPAYPENFIRGTEPTAVSPIRYTGSWQGLWPRHPGRYYFRHFGPVPGKPLYNRLMGFKTPSGSP